MDYYNINFDRIYKKESSIKSSIYKNKQVKENKLEKYNKKICSLDLWKKKRNKNRYIKNYNNKINTIHPVEDEFNFRINELLEFNKIDIEYKINYIQILENKLKKTKKLLDEYSKPKTLINIIQYYNIKGDCFSLEQQIRSLKHYIKFFY